MAKEKQSFADNHPWLLRVVVVILSISMFVLPYLGVTRTTLSSADNTIAFLEASNTFNYTSQIVKNEVNARLPESVQQNIIERSIVNKLMDLLITPQLIQNIAEPVVKVQITLLQRKNGNVELVNNQVVFNLEPYKQNLSSYISSLGLPSGVQSTVSSFANSLPNSITLVDGQKNPNSPVITALKVKQYYNTVMQLAMVMWVVLFLAIIALVGLLYRDFRRLARVSAKLWLVWGAVVLLLSYLAPPGLNLLVPNNLTEASGPEIAQLINALNAHFFVLTRSYSWWYLGIGVVSLVAAWYLKTFGLKFSVKQIQTYGHTQLNKLKRQNK